MMIIPLSFSFATICEWDPNPHGHGEGGADQKAKHGAMTPGPYLNGSTHWWAWAIHVGLLDRWTTALLESDTQECAGI